MIKIEKALIICPTAKSVTVKLGGDCNLDCPHCHCEVKEFSYNPDIVRWIRLQPNIRRVSFYGGEPLLYWDTIQAIIEALGDSYSYMFVTNGTLLTEDIIDFCNDNNVSICMSFDGRNSKRDASIEPRWDLASSIKHLAFSCYSSGTNNIYEITEDAKAMVAKYNLRGLYDRGNVFLAFVHEKANADCARTNEDVDEYLHWMKLKIEESFKEALNGSEDAYLFLNKIYKKFYERQPIKYGVACSNDRVMTVALDGRFMGCQYNQDFFGDIYTGFDTAKLERLTPDKCKKCPAWDYCHSTCFVNTTNHQCRIVNTIHRFAKEMEVRYNLSLKELFGENNVR